MAYGILRVQKYKKAAGASIRKTIGHTCRDYKPGKFPSNVDETMTPYNREFADIQHAASAGEVAQWMYDKYSEVVGKAQSVRKDAVGLLEFVATFSHGALPVDKEEEYFRDARMFISNLYGQGSVCGIAIHRDEQTPHMHVFVVPLEMKTVKKKQTAEEKKSGDRRTETKRVLNAQKVTGDKETLSKLQDRYYEKVSRLYGLERGRPAAETGAKHQKHSLDARERLINEAAGVSAVEIASLKKRAKIAEERLDVWRGKTPEELRRLAAEYERYGARTYTDCQKAKEREKRQNQGRG
jgi:hypothetical protein